MFLMLETALQYKQRHTVPIRLRDEHFLSEKVYNRKKCGFPKKKLDSQLHQIKLADLDSQLQPWDGILLEGIDHTDQFPRITNIICTIIIYVFLCSLFHIFVIMEYRVFLLFVIILNSNISGSFQSIPMILVLNYFPYIRIL